MSIIEDFIIDIKKRTGIQLNKNNVDVNIDGYATTIKIDTNILEIIYLNKYKDYISSILLNIHTGLEDIGNNIYFPYHTEYNSIYIDFKPHISNNMRYNILKKINYQINKIINLSVLYLEKIIQKELKNNEYI